MRYLIFIVRKKNKKKKKQQKDSKGMKNFARWDKAQLCLG